MKRMKEVVADVRLLEGRGLKMAKGNGRLKKNKKQSKGRRAAFIIFISVTPPPFSLHII